MDKIPISKQLQNFIDTTNISEVGISQMSGISQSALSMVLHNKYPSMPVKLIRFLNSGSAILFVDISIKLKELSVEKYGGDFPDFIAIRRMELHRHRSELMNEKRMHQPSNLGASLAN